MKKYVIVAGSHDEFEKWRDSQFVYVGDKYALGEINPADVRKVIFIGNFDQHPFYWTDDLLRFQMDVALASRNIRVGSLDDVATPTKHGTWWQRFLRRLG